MFLEILQNFGLGLLGILLFVLIASRREFVAKTFRLDTHFKENYMRWIWEVSVLLVLVIILQVEPTIAKQLNEKVGVDLIDKSGSYILLGLTLGGLVLGTVEKVIYIEQ